MCRLLDTLPALQLPSWYIGAGAVAQTVWNHLHGLPSSHGVKDYDVVYFDPDDLTPDGEHAVGAKVAELLDSAVTVDVTNEARVPLCGTGRSLPPPCGLLSLGSRGEGH